MVPPPTPDWALWDWSVLRDAVFDFSLPPCPARVTTNAVARWFAISSTGITHLLTSHAPSRCPCPRSKPGWSPGLLALRQEYHRVARLSSLNPSPLNWDNMKSARWTYFKVVSAAKRNYCSDFLVTATLHSVCTAKRFAFGHPPQRFPTLPTANGPEEVAEALLTNFFPLRAPLTHLLSLACHEDYTPLTLEEVSRALARSLNTSTAAPDHIPYYVWKCLHHLKSSLLPSLLDPLLAHGFPPPPSRKPLVLFSTSLESFPMTPPLPSGLSWSFSPSSRLSRE